MTSKDQLEQQYLDLQQSRLSVAIFEEWLYTEEGLEDSIGEDLYQELIILDYNSANIKSDLRKLLSDYIDVDRHKREAFITKLDAIIQKETNTAALLIEMHDYYRQGYAFLEDLGMGIGVLVKMPPVEYAAETFDDLSLADQIRLIDRLHSLAKPLAKTVKAWINEQEIILFQEEEFTVGKLLFKDYRTEEEKQSKIWKAHRDPETMEISYKRNRLLDERGHLRSQAEMTSVLLLNGLE